MLEKIRDGSQGIVAKSILGVVILSFVVKNMVDTQKSCLLVC